LLIALSSFLSDEDDGWSWPSPETLSRLTGLSVRQVKAWHAEGQAAGYLVRRSRGHRSRDTQIQWRRLPQGCTECTDKGATYSPRGAQVAHQGCTECTDKGAQAAPDPTMDPTRIRPYPHKPPKGAACVLAVDPGSLLEELRALSGASTPVSRRGAQRLKSALEAHTPDELRHAARCLATGGVSGFSDEALGVIREGWCWLREDNLERLVDGRPAAVKVNPVVAMTATWKVHANEEDEDETLRRFRAEMGQEPMVEAS